MPMFAVTGCDYGNQTLADPASGHSTAPVPTLYANADTNSIDLTADTQVLKDSTGTDVDFLVKDSTGNKLRFEGSRWSAARRIGFFRSDDATVDPTNQGPNTTFWHTGCFPETNLNPNPPGTGYTKPSPAEQRGDRRTRHPGRGYRHRGRLVRPRPAGHRCRGPLVAHRLGAADPGSEVLSSARWTSVPGNFGTLEFPAPTQPPRTTSP